MTDIDALVDWVRAEQQAADAARKAALDGLLRACGAGMADAVDNFNAARRRVAVLEVLEVLISPPGNLPGNDETRRGCLGALAEAVQLGRLIDARNAILKHRPRNPAVTETTP